MVYRDMIEILKNTLERKKNSLQIWMILSDIDFFMSSNMRHQQIIKCLCRNFQHPFRFPLVSCRSIKKNAHISLNNSLFIFFFFLICLASNTNTTLRLSIWSIIQCEIRNK